MKLYNYKGKQLTGQEINQRRHLEALRTTTCQLKFDFHRLPLHTHSVAGVYNMPQDETKQPNDKVNP